GKSQSRPPASRIAGRISNRIVTSAKCNSRLSPDCIARSTDSPGAKHNRKRQLRRLSHVNAAPSFSCSAGILPALLTLKVAFDLAMSR
ncbi:MAG TPA: hypothetical protein VKR59_10170, partial [Terriglobales bacterium]|nr:hypothetical protein [Terriglobales bacterium]